jgi:hypothetical protein
MDSLLEKYIDELYKIAQSEWLALNNKNQATIALCFYRRGQQTIANNIVNALYEKSIYQEAMGRYWNWNTQLKWVAGDIEAHSRILEAFSVIHKKKRILQRSAYGLCKTKEVRVGVLLQILLLQL